MFIKVLVGIMTFVFALILVMGICGLMGAIDDYSQEEERREHEDE